jgi:hypothetical protein
MNFKDPTIKINFTSTCEHNQNLYAFELGFKTKETTFAFASEREFVIIERIKRKKSQQGMIIIMIRRNKYLNGVFSFHTYFKPHLFWPFNL